MAFARKWGSLEHLQRPLPRSSLLHFQSQTLPHRPNQPCPSRPRPFQPGGFAFNAVPRTLLEARFCNSCGVKLPELNS